MKSRDKWISMHWGSPIGHMEVIKYVYTCSKHTYQIKNLSLTMYRNEDSKEILYNRDNDTIELIHVSDVDTINTTALKTPIYLTKRNDAAVFEHWKNLIILSKNDYLEKVKRLDEYLESLES